MNVQHGSGTAELERLDPDSGFALADPRQDIRGRQVIDPNGEAIGHVSELFIDKNERKVRMVEVRGGGFLGLRDRHVLVPADAIVGVSDREVRVNETRERIASSPAYDPKLLADAPRDSWEPFYGYYGLSPYWGTGYLYPGFPMTSEEAIAHDRHVQARD